MTGLSGRSAAILVALVLALAAGLIVHPVAGAVIVVLAVLTGACGFVNNEGGHMTRDLSIITVVVAYTLVSLAIAHRRGRWRPPSGPFALALWAFLGWTAISCVHGAWVGNPLKFIFLEIAAFGT